MLNGVGACLASQAAAQHYFGKSAHQLTRSEAARLAVMLPPTRAITKAAPASPYLQARARTIAARIGRRGDSLTSSPP